MVLLRALRRLALAEARATRTHLRLVHVLQDQLHLVHVLGSADFQRREFRVDVDLDVVTLVEDDLEDADKSLVEGNRFHYCFLS